MHTTPLAVRFYKKFVKTDTCWVWTAFKLKSGYGMIGGGGRGVRPLLAHRVSWELHRGPIPEGQYVLHSCDNPACVRPDHLFLGSQTENMKDRDAKGRCPKGEGHYKAVLNDDLVRAVRVAKGTQREIARRFGLDYRTVNEVVLRKTWKHVV